MTASARAISPIRPARVPLLVAVVAVARHAAAEAALLPARRNAAGGGTARFDECFVFREACEHAVRVPREAVGPRVVLLADFANPLLARDADYLGAALGVGEGGGPEGAAAVTAALAERDAFVRERWRAQLSGRERDEL